MNTIFVNELKSKVYSNLSDIDKDMAEVCLAIIEHVSVGPSKKSHLTFTYLYSIGPKVNEAVFYEAVFYLTLRNIDVLEQQFEAIEPRTCSFQSIPNKEDFIEDMRDGELYNPFIGDLLSEKEFGEQVITYFSPSKYFMERVNG
ncbi:hypothetical protein [Psychrobacter sp. SWN149]|uniref:hypothetical protein n=1 Tax=Psychrobacter sp. SWN149 TaxID=2792057 RepID=UPI0018CDFE88|nr:hypothetical protein [Psychrobacter sp. SWN149]MBH0005569.1 hypothetical protein [Psychrobacter sp. SWN149]